MKKTDTVLKMISSLICLRLLCFLESIAVDSDALDSEEEEDRTVKAALSSSPSPSSSM